MIALGRKRTNSPEVAKHAMSALATILVLAGALPPLACAQAARWTADSSTISSPFRCLDAEGAQQVRDGLETARTYLKKTKDNFGAGRQGAIDAVEEAVAEFDALQGNAWIEPAASTKVARSVGAHGHPRMMLAWNALSGVKQRLGGEPCLGVQALERLRARVDDALRNIDDAFRFNPPWSRH